MHERESIWKKLKREEINIKNFRCERLEPTRDHKAIIAGFHSERNPNLATYLQKKALTENSQNNRAVYLVRDKNRIVLFFSLQCGLTIQCDKKEITGIIHIEENNTTKYMIDTDNVNVTKVVPGVELCHFCVNSSYARRKKEWRIKHGIFNYRVGVYIFYRYIAPIILDIASRAGLQYVYLYVADDGSGELIKYYEQELNFSIMDDMACLQSDYDRDLHCMILKINTLRVDYGHFNDKKHLCEIMEQLKLNGSLKAAELTEKYDVRDSAYILDLIVETGEAEIIEKNKHGKIRKIKHIRSSTN